MKKMNSYGLTLLFVLFSVVLSCLFYAKHWYSNETQGLIPIKVSVSRTPLSTPFFVANELGLFQQNGLDAELFECLGGNECFKQVMSGQSDYGTGSESVLMFAAFDSANYSNLASFVESGNDLKFLIKKTDHEAVETLMGKRIGIIPKSASEYYLSLILGLYHLNVSDVKLIALLPNEMKDALEKDKVDAVVIWEPYAFEIQQKLNERVAFLESGRLYTLYFNLVTRQNYGKANIETSKKLLQSLNQAISFIHKHPQKAKAILKKRLALHEDFIDWVWPDYFYRLSLNRSLMLTLKDEARWALKSKIISSDRMPNFEDFVDARPLKEIEPIAVSIE